MNRNDLKDLWEKHFNSRPQGAGTWLKCRCPMAPHTTAHSKNVDSRPSLSISADEENISWARCFTCSSGTGEPLLQFLRTFVKMAKCSPELITEFEKKEKSKTKLLIPGKKNQGEEREDAAEDKDYTATYLQFTRPPSSKWLCGKGIDLTVAYRFGLRSNIAPLRLMDALGMRRTGIIFPYFAADRETCIGIKYRPFQTQGSKYWSPCSFQQAMHIYGFWMLPSYVIDEDTPVFLCEGELDVLHLATIGLIGIACAGTSLSPAQAQLIEGILEGQTLYVLADPDEAGAKLVANAKKQFSGLKVECVGLNAYVTKDPKTLRREEILTFVEKIERTRKFFRNMKVPNQSKETDE